MFAVKRQGRG